MGGGGSRYIPKPDPERVRQLIKDNLKKTEGLNQDGEINLALRALLSEFNSRDKDTINSVLDEVKQACSDLELDRLLLGGSVAKHTYVNGLSDIDALVVMDKGKGSPQELLQALYDELAKKLHYKVTKGTIAVTINAKGHEIQLVPCYQSGEKFKIADESGKSWRTVNPAKFREKLSQENERLNNALIRSIKLVKSLNATLPESQRLSGYHLEALALSSVKKYDAAKTLKAVTLHILDRSSQLVLSPSKDPTGQSDSIDSALGKENSPLRQSISKQLSQLSHKLKQAKSAEEWCEIIKGK